MGIDRNQWLKLSNKSELTQADLLEVVGYVIACENLDTSICKSQDQFTRADEIREMRAEVRNTYKY